MPARHLDLDGLPPLSRYAARDGAPLAYRYCPAPGNRVAILLHGSGTESYAPDLRGHGASGRRGDIDYMQTIIAPPDFCPFSAA